FWNFRRLSSNRRIFHDRVSESSAPGRACRETRDSFGCHRVRRIAPRSESALSPRGVSYSASEILCASGAACSRKVSARDCRLRSRRMATVHVLTQYIWPDAAPTGLYAEQLASRIARKGGRVRLVGGQGGYRELQRPIPDCEIVHLDHYRGARGSL